MQTKDTHSEIIKMQTHIRMSDRIKGMKNKVKQSRKEKIAIAKIQQEEYAYKDIN